MATAGRGAARGPTPSKLINVDSKYMDNFCNLLRGGSDYKDEVLDICARFVTPVILTGK
jgi:hypothetical protein